MTRPCFAVIATSLLLRASSTSASMELILPLSSFKIESRALGPSSPIEVSGTQSQKGPSELTVKAFGRNYSLDPSQLRQLEGAEVNGLELTYEAGSPVIGGRQLYLLLSRGPTQRRITFTERGEVRIEEPAHR